MSHKPPIIPKMLVWASIRPHNTIMCVPTYPYSCRSPKGEAWSRSCWSWSQEGWRSRSSANRDRTVSINKLIFRQPYNKYCHKLWKFSPLCDIVIIFAQHCSCYLATAALLPISHSVAGKPNCSVVAPSPMHYPPWNCSFASHPAQNHFRCHRYRECFVDHPDLFCINLSAEY